MLQALDFRVPSLGESAIRSPLAGIRFVPESERILHISIDLTKYEAGVGADIKAAGPHERSTSIAG